jgi:hypothetical protein
MRKRSEARFAGGLSCRPKTRFSLAGLERRSGGGLRSIRTIVVGLLKLLMWSAAPLRRRISRCLLGRHRIPYGPGWDRSINRTRTSPSSGIQPIGRIFWDPLKYIPLDSAGEYYLTFGFEDRSEHEWFQNEMWGKSPQTVSGYWLQRVIPEASLTLESHVRVFASFQ